MRLVSVDISNYRVIEALHLDLAPGLNLLIGPNESGKSTLVEAVGMALFAKAGGEPELIKSAKRAGCDALPEVKVVFEHEDGQRYRVVKRFGKGGATRLEEEGGGRAGRAWSGDEADEKLSELMGVGEPLKGKGVTEKGLNLRWGHLCVTQGWSTEDPLGGEALDNIRRDELMAVLAKGGQELALDPVDRAIRDRVESRYKEKWTIHPSPRHKQKGQVETAQKELEKAKAELEEANNACEQLAAAQRDLETSSARLTELEGLRQDREKRLEELRGQLASGQKLESEKERLEQELVRLKRSWDELSRRHERVLALEKELGAAEKDGARALAQMQGFGAELAHLDGKLASEIEERDKEKGKEQGLLARRELLEAKAALVILEGQLESHEGEQRLIEETEAALSGVEERLAGTIPVDDERLADLEKLLRGKEQAEARLEGMVTRVELLEAGCQVELAGALLEPGHAVRLDRPAELAVGPHARLRLVPGGGEDLSQAREAAREAQAELERACTELGVQGVEQARVVKGKRDALTLRASELKAALKASKPAKVKERLSSCRQELEGAKARLELLLGRVCEDARLLPGEMEGLQQEITALEGRITEIRATVEKWEERVQATRAARETVSLGLDAAREEHRKKDNEVGQLRATLVEASKDLADKGSREAELASEEAKVEEATGQLREIEERLEQLELPRLRLDLERYQAQEKADADERLKLRERETRSETLLGGHGRQDPRERMILAVEELKRWEEAHRNTKLDADADRLLYEALMEAEAELQQRVALPLKARIEDYLYDLFEEEGRVEVSVGKTLAMESLGRRSRGEFEFGRLSTGTRQQVAAAVRLSVAGIMASEHGGCLPVIMDDAFGASDEGRLDGVQRMLSTAARGGLQIILLGCMPRDWAGIGECNRLQLPLPRVSQAGSWPGARGASVGLDGWAGAEVDGGEDVDGLDAGDELEDEDEDQD
ncbi:MAG: AAA family ATPase [Polyangia bacterium]|jgi:DNA repair exonuclease SbcCD ATPase subunit|nr:AAA family ATPase [Polyangia bacterium]